MNRQNFPSSLFPMRGDVSAEAGATKITVVGIQTIPVVSPPVEPADMNTFFYSAYNNEWYYASPWVLPIGQVLEWEGYGYGSAGLSWLASDTLAVGNGTPGDVSGAMAMTGLILFSAEPYSGSYYYEDFYTTVYSGATQDWSMTLPTGPGSANQFLQTNGAGVTSWATVASSGLYTVTDQTSNYLANSYDDVWCTGTFNVTLPSPTVITRVKVSNRGTGMITVIGTINGVSNLIIARQYSSAEFASDGTAWGIE